MGDAFLYKSSDLQQGPVLGKSPKIATPAHVKLSVTAQMDYSLGFVSGTLIHCVSHPNCQQQC